MRIKGNGIPDIIQFKRLLRDRGLKATPQRSAVHEAMWNLVHAGADDVAAWIAAHGSVRVSPASVYNIQHQALPFCHRARTASDRRSIPCRYRSQRPRRHDRPNGSRFQLCIKMVGKR